MRSKQSQEQNQNLKRGKSTVQRENSNNRYQENVESRRLRGYQNEIKRKDRSLRTKQGLGKGSEKRKGIKRQKGGKRAV